MVTRGTRNVFADLGCADAIQRQAKLRMAFAINRELAARQLTQVDAAKVLGVTQSRVSELRRYRLTGFSIERLMRLLAALGYVVDIVIWQQDQLTAAIKGAE